MTNDPNPTGRIFHGSAYDLFSVIHSNSVRLVLTDPPYDVARDNNFETMGRSSIDFPWDGKIDHLAWLEEADRVLMPGGSLAVFYDWKKINDLTLLVELELGYEVKRPIIWRKTK